MSKEQELKEMLKLYSKQDLWNRIQEKQAMIYELEAKLAESKQETNDWKQRFESSEERCKTFNSNGVTALNLKNEKIEKLKQQLAEKDKEIEKLKHVKVTIGTMENNQVDISSTTYIDQDKISFAIEQLEEVKWYIENDKDWKVFEVIKLVKQFIDNQINELKGFLDI